MQALTAFPFTSELTYDAKGWPQLDRAVDAAVLRKCLSNYYNDGVFAINWSSCFQVTATDDGTARVIVKPGVALVKGATGYAEVDTVVVMPEPDDSLPRIDTVVIRLNDNTDYRNMYLDVIEGAAASTPVAPALTQTDSIYEIGLANIYRTANSTSISGSNITDTRQDSSRCGYVTAITELDTSTLMAQLNAYYAEFQTDAASWMEQKKVEFDEWLSTLKNKLSGDVAANLQLQIGTLDALKTKNKSNLVAAINEVNEKVDVLDTREEIQANTTAGKVAGALPVKELYSSLQDSNTSESFNFGSLNGVRGFFTDPARADDSFVPFNKPLSVIDTISGRINGKNTDTIDLGALLPSNKTDLYIFKVYTYLFSDELVNCTSESLAKSSVSYSSGSSYGYHRVYFNHILNVNDESKLLIKSTSTAGGGKYELTIMA